MPTWEAIYKALHNIENALGRVRDDNHILHVLAHAAQGDCSFDRKRFAAALARLCEHMDTSIDRLCRDYNGACDLAFDRDRALAEA